MRPSCERCPALAEPAEATESGQTVETAEGNSREKQQRETAETADGQQWVVSEASSLEVNGDYFRNEFSVHHYLYVHWINSAERARRKPAASGAFTRFSPPKRSIGFDLSETLYRRLWRHILAHVVGFCV